MAKQLIGIGQAADDGTGDTLRVAINKVNNNFLEIYTLIGDASSLTSGISATATVVTLTAPLIVTSISPTSSGGAALGANSLEWSGLFLAGGAVVNFGSSQDVTLTHVANTGVLLNSTNQLQFGDSGTHISQSADGVLDLVADTEIEINATTIDVNGNLDVSGTIVAAGALTAATSITVGSAVLTEAELEALDGITAGTVLASKAIITDSDKDITGGRNITITGALTSATLDISGNVDVDGTLEADAITVNGTTLAETISDTVGAMVGSNTETGITVSYVDGDNTLDFVMGTTQSTITSLTNAALVVGRDADNDIDFATDNNIIFRAGGADQIKLIDGALAPVTDSDIDLGTASLEFKDAFFDGTVTSDAFAGPLTGEVTGNAATATTLATARTIGGTSFNGSANIAVALSATATALATARTIGGTSFDGSANIAVALSATATALATARTIGGVSFNGTANINLPGVNSAGNQNTSGSAATLTTARTIGGTSFDGSANIAVALAAAATTLETARTIGGVSFNGSANINLPGVNAAGNQSTSGLAATATALATARTIGGTSFDGSANIAVALSATATALATARTIGGTSFDGSANIAVGLAAEATILETARTIAGVSFDGSANIALATTDLTSVTAVAGEVNALDLGSTAIGTAIASKAVVLDSDKDYTGIRNLTITGEIDAATGDYSGAVDVAGATTVVGLTATGDIKATDGVVSGKREIISTFNTSSAVTGSLTRAQSGGILLIDGTENNVINLPAAATANVGTFYDYIVLTIGASDKTTIFNIAGSGGNFFGTLSLSGGTAANAVIDNGGDALTLVNSTVVGSRGRITCLVDNGTNGTWQVESVGSPIATIA